MKFSNTLEATMLPEWRQHYINYKALKKVLKQARSERDQGVDFLAASPQTTSLSVARSLAAAVGSPRSSNLLQQHQEQRHQGQEHDSSSGGGSAPSFTHSITPFSTAQEHFLQMLQQELSKVHKFIQLQAAQLSTALEFLAAAAPQLAAAAWQDLESQARELGQQLLALEGFVQQNQAGFVKIVKKHDKYLPESPVWHLYLHHLLRSPWLDEQQQQYMWAALSSCYYHLHASMLRRRSRRRGASSKRQQQQSSAAGSSNRQQQQHQQQQQEGTGGKRFGGILPAIGSAVTAAAAGAATAVAGAATAVAAATRPAALTASTAAPELQREKSTAGTLSFTRKFWVAQENVSAVTYLILQHLPLLPSTTYAGGSNEQPHQQQRGFGTSRQVSRAPSPFQDPDTQQQQQQQQSSAELQPQQPQQQQQQQRHLHDLAGFTTTLHTAYFDNKALELYHGRLYLRPLTQTLKARWISREAAGSGLSHDEEINSHNSVSNYPDKVVLERKVYKEGWKGEKNVKDSLLISGEKLPAYLAGAYNLSDALQQLYEYPALRQQMQQQGPSAATDVQQPQLPQQSPFASYTAITAMAADGMYLPGSQQQQEQERDAATAVASGIKVPQGVVLGASSSGSRVLTTEGASSEAPGREHSDAQDVKDVPGQQQQQQLDSQTPSTANSLQQPAARSYATLQKHQNTNPNISANSNTRTDSIGFEDAYLDPPVPSADQLSLFTEVQRLVTRKGLGPVLHSVVQRMLFAMPFDDRIKVTLDTDVKMSAVVEEDPLLALPSFSSTSFTQAAALRGYSSSGGGSSTHNQQLQSDQPQQETPVAAVSGPFGVPSPRVTAAIAAAEAEAYATWGDIFAAEHSSRRSSYVSITDSSRPTVGSPHSRYATGARGKLVYGMPYALLKVSVRLPAGQSTIPGWLQQLMDSDTLIPVEDWSKFVQGCAVLLPEVVRAVPYWIDDPLVDMSVQNIQAELDAQMARREEAQRAWHVSRLRTASSTGSEQQQHGITAQTALSSGPSRILSRIASSVGQLIPGSAPSGPQVFRHSTSDTGYSSDGGGFGRQGGSSPEGSAVPLSSTNHESATAGGIAGGSYSNAGGSPSRLRYSSTGGLSDNHHQQQQQQQHAAAAVGSSKAVAWADDLTSVTGIPPLRSITVHSHEGTSNSLQSLEHQQQHSSSNVEGGRQLVRRLTSLVRRKEQAQPLFRPEGRSEPIARRYKRWGHPVQLLECREFFYSESIFLDWLKLAITMASTAILLLGYSAMAYYNPLKRPALHLAEIISLLLLPTSCIMVGYAIRVYIWRGKRLHSMRHRRVDDQIGPILMTLVFVTAMFAILLVNMADLYLLLKYRHKHAGGDDESGGDVTPADMPDVYY